MSGGSQVKRTLLRALGNERGMTILEVLVALVIVGLLATLGSIQLFGLLGRAKSDTAKLQIRELTAALDLLRLDLGRYPNEEEGLKALLERPGNLEGWRGPYLKTEKALTDPWGRPYQYGRVAESGEFRVRSLGADGVAGGSGENADLL